MARPTIPHAPAIERRVLASCLVEPESLQEALQSLRSDDFYLAANRKVFETLLRLSKQPGATQDPALVRHACGTDEGTLVALDEATFDTSWFGADVGAACAYLRDLSAARRLHEAAMKTAAAALECSDDPTTYLDKATEQLVSAIQSRQSSTKLSTINEVMQRVIARMTNADNAGENFVSTGFQAVDNVLGGGWERGRMYVPAGRPGMGKTAFMMQCVANAAFKGKRCAVFSIEMPEELLGKRLLATATRLNSRWMKPGSLRRDQTDAALKMAERLADLPIVFPDSASISIEELIRTCRRMSVDGGLDLVAVDYLQLITTTAKSDSREQEVSSISRQLKRMARSLNIPVIALSQLSRKVEDRTDKRPQLNDLRESGAIEQDADAILFLFRPDYYQRDGKNHNGECEIIVAKNRDGETGFVSLKFDPEFTHFSDPETARHR